MPYKLTLVNDLLLKPQIAEKQIRGWSNRTQHDDKGAVTLRKEKSKLAMGKAREDSLPERSQQPSTAFSAAAGSRGWFPGRTESVALVEAQEAKIKAILGHQGCRFLGKQDLSIVCEVSAKLALFPREPTLPFYLQRSPKHLRPAMMVVGKEERNAACWL